jgi:hypothetical protein
MKLERNQGCSVHITLQISGSNNIFINHQNTFLEGDVASVDLESNETCYGLKNWGRI